MASLEDDMMKPFGRGLGVAAIAAMATALGASPSQAHHSDWGLPLVGGLVGGAGLTALYYNSQRHDEQRSAPAAQVVQPVYVTPAAAAAPAVPSATTIEDKLNVLDQLAAKGYITPAQYQARRQALLDQL
jgi:drug/metabolite transporter (DMT)-like permease